MISISKKNKVEVLRLKKIIVKLFNPENWLELNLILDSNVIDEHPRLLRSLHFGDPDYSSNVLDVLMNIVDENVEDFGKIKNYINTEFEESDVKDVTDIVDASVTISEFSVFKPVYKKIDDKLVAVMFPFKFQKSFNAINMACKKLSLKCKKADDIWNDSTYIQDIFELICTAKVIVADFSEKNPNVFYEVGIAHALGKIVVPIAQSKDDIPSDLRHHRYLKYNSNEQGYLDLSNKVQERLATLFKINDNNSTEIDIDSLPF